MFQRTLSLQIVAKNLLLKRAKIFGNTIHYSNLFKLYFFIDFLANCSKKFDKKK